MVPSKVLCFHSSFFIRTVDHDRNRSMMMNINFDWDWGFAVHSPKHGKVPSSCIYIIYTRRSQLKTIIQIDAKHQPNKTEQTSPKSRANAKLNYKSLFFRVRPVFFFQTLPRRFARSMGGSKLKTNLSAWCRRKLPMALPTTTGSALMMSNSPFYPQLHNTVLFCHAFWMSPTHSCAPADGCHL